MLTELLALSLIVAVVAPLANRFAAALSVQLPGPVHVGSVSKSCTIKTSFPSGAMTEIVQTFEPPEGWQS